MRLGIFIQHYFPYGGLQRDSLRLAEAALAAGDEPILVVSEWDGPKPENIKVLELKCGGSRNHQKAKLFAQACQKLYKEEQLDTAICFSRVPGTPFHFCGDPCYKERFVRTKPSWLAMLPRYRYLLDNEQALFGSHSHTHVFYLAASEIPAYQKYYSIPQERYTLLPPWLKKPEQHELNKESLKAKLLTELDLSAKGPLFLFVGSDFKRKGLDLAIQALAKLDNKDAVLVACGKYDPTNYLKLARELGVSDRVRIPGPRDDIPEWMAAADLLVHPARQETAGMVLLESLTYHLPVVCTENCGYAQFIEEAGCQPVNEGSDEDELAASIQQHLDQNEQLQQSIENWLTTENRYNTADIMLENIRASL